MKFALFRLLVPLVLSAVPALPQGTISGCITDVSGGKLPGTTVTVWGTQVKQQVVTQASGCYAVADLLPGTYTVTAELAGFRHRKAVDIQVRSSETTRVDLTLPVGAVEGAPPPDNLAELWDFADWIVHGYIEDSMPGPWGDYVRQVIAPRTVLTWHPAPPAEARQIDLVQSYVETPYHKGDEVVLLLRDAGAFKMQPLGGQAAFMVKQGHVHAVSDRLRVFENMTVEDLLTKLRTLAKGPR